jgi:hypothetical protein
LGATLFHLVVGNAPPSPLENANDDAPLIPGSLSENVRETLRRALQPLPESRLQSVREFLDLLEGRAPEDVTHASCTRSRTRVLTPANPNAVTVNSANLPQNSSSSNAAAPATGATATVPASPPTSASPPPVAGFVAASALDEKLKSRVWRVALDEVCLRDLKWPGLCPCCGQSCAVNSMSFFEIGKGGRSWKVPHCDECAVHTDGTRTAVFVTIWGMVGGTLISMVGLALKSLLMGPFGIVVYFSAASYGALKTADADSRTKRECVDKKIAVSFLGTRFINGRNIVVFEFRRPDYAEAFRQINNAVWG